jgi:hypothetical protein
VRRPGGQDHGDGDGDGAWLECLGAVVGPEPGGPGGLLEFRWANGSRFAVPPQRCVSVTATPVAAGARGAGRTSGDGPTGRTGAPRGHGDARGHGEVPRTGGTGGGGRGGRTDGSGGDGREGGDADGRAGLRLTFRFEPGGGPEHVTGHVAVVLFVAPRHAARAREFVKRLTAGHGIRGVVDAAPPAPRAPATPAPATPAPADSGPWLSSPASHETEALFAWVARRLADTDA